MDNPVAIPLTSVYVARLIFYSFYFSQGSAKLQRIMFHYISLAFPTYSVQQDQREEIRAQLLRMTIAYIDEPGKSTEGAHRHSHQDIKTIEDTCVDWTDIAIGFFLKTRKPSSRRGKALIANICYLAITRDHKFIVQLAGRSRKTSCLTHAIYDPLLSQVCHYGLRGNRTGSCEFDLIYNRIANRILETGHDFQPNYKCRLSKVITVFNNASDPALHLNCSTFS